MNNQDKLLGTLHQLGRLLTKDEIVEFYVDNVQQQSMKYSDFCNFEEVQSTQTGELSVISRGGEKEYYYEEIVRYAKTWYQRTLGCLIISGKLKLQPF